MGVAGEFDRSLSWLYVNSSYKVKEMVSQQFNLEQPLYFSYTHLVCRTAKEGKPRLPQAWLTLAHLVCVCVCEREREREGVNFADCAGLQADRKDISHPAHADNCHVDEAGECHKKPPAYTWRDYR